MSSLKAKPIIKGKINGQNAYFLIDTGADITLLDSKDAKKFQYRLSFPNNHKSIVGFSGRAVSLSGVKKWKC
ncbi:MAG: aspartyl protease family protein [Flammeovirgaceae bacterium]|nr:aspartyl protease family protein [Flammeovirgaceae bacterium]